MPDLSYFLVHSQTKRSANSPHIGNDFVNKEEMYLVSTDCICKYFLL